MEKSVEYSAKIKEFTKFSPPLFFPRSTHPRFRHLVIRNPTQYDLFFKITADTNELAFDSYYGELPSCTLVKIDIKCDSGKNPSNIGNIFVYVRPRTHVKRFNLISWFTGDSHKRSELAFIVPVSRTNEFAAMETVIDMPGSATMIESVQTPHEGVDDSDTTTAVHIERDTRTARVFSMTDLNEFLPSETLLDTCHNIASDTSTGRNIISDTNTARDINEKNMIQQILDYLFPLPDRLAKKKTTFKDVFPCGQNSVSKIVANGEKVEKK